MLESSYPPEFKVFSKKPTVIAIRSHIKTHDSESRGQEEVQQHDH